MTQNKVALITAGASGIGLAIARRFLAEGLKVHVCDVFANGIKALPETLPGATGSVADVADIDQVAALFDDVERVYGRLDVLVNNAGIAGPVSRFEDISPQDWNRTIEVDLNGVFYVTRLAIPLLRRAGGGSIINLSSTAGLFGCPMRAPYVASKWALIGVTKTLAMELGPEQIRVNAICPGSVNGPRIEGVIERTAASSGQQIEDIRTSWTEQISMRRFVEAEDIAAMAWFLASPEGRYVSGQSLAVDGHTESLSSPLD
ncbi:MAG: SDR family oxidoreductase [Xanthomonadales bacterium]|nr:SDR family oxidoreductase [Xanthomonadales bacterium]